MLTCSWDLPKPLEYTILEYTLRYKLADGFDYYPGYGNIIETSLHASTLQYTIESLQPYGGYLIELQANVSSEVASSGIGSAVPSQPEALPTSYMIIQASTVNNTLPHSKHFGQHQVILIM